MKQGHCDAALFGQVLDDGEDFKGTLPDVQGEEDAFRSSWLILSANQPSRFGDHPFRCVERQVQAQHVYAGVAQDAEAGGVGVLLDEFAHLFDAQAAGLGDAVGLEAAFSKLICGSRPLPEPVTASAGTGALVAKPFWAR